MKKQTFGAIFTLILAIFSPLTANAALVQAPVDMYGYTDSILNTWTNDTTDAQDNDAAGDVDWFLPVPGFNMNNPREVYLGGLQKYSGFAITIGNSPVAAGQRAKFDFFYGAVVNGQVTFKPLKVKDVDGGMAVSNQTYRYTFAPPADWNSAITPHVQAPGLYYLKMVCRDNCLNGGPNGNFQVNQMTLTREVVLPRLPSNNKCVFRPTSLQCIAHL